MKKSQNSLTPTTLKVGGRYHWKHQPKDKLIYLGRALYGNVFWHQFKKIGDPRHVWCEVQDSEISLFEETKNVGGPT